MRLGSLKSASRNRPSCKKHGWITAAACGFIIAAGSAWALAQPQREGGGGGAGGMGEMLIKGLLETEGCLGADAAQMRSGKNVIMAWFEDAEAARRWYAHPTHRRMLFLAGGVDPDKKPLEHVPDGVPVMVMASLTMSNDGSSISKTIPVPISQISIEMYTPLPGGAMINGRLSPEAFPFEHMRDMTAPVEETP
ncbi:MAG: hypothetical protein AAF138_11500 [Planctomycetota bacterium]